MHTRALRQFHNVQVRGVRSSLPVLRLKQKVASQPRRPYVGWSQPVMRSQRNSLLAIWLIFEVAPSPSGAAAGSSSWVGRIEGVGTCGVSPNLCAGLPPSPERIVISLGSGYRLCESRRAEREAGCRKARAICNYCGPASQPLLSGRSETRAQNCRQARSKNVEPRGWFRQARGPRQKKPHQEARLFRLPPGLPTWRSRKAPVGSPLQPRGWRLVAVSALRRGAEKSPAEAGLS
jgi:hypothetical protein